MKVTPAGSPTGVGSSRPRARATGSKMPRPGTGVPRPAERDLVTSWWRVTAGPWTRLRLPS